MSDFAFLHAADIHLDSPLHGLSNYEGVPVDEVRAATRAAFDNMIRYAVSERVAFVILAGDLFDGDWRDMGTGLYFAGAVARLTRAGIRVIVLRGNHDAASVITSSLPWPEGVNVFHARRAETIMLDEFGVALHGQSFINPHVTANLASAYPEPVPNAFNIGVLHTALEGHPAHASYAPCSLQDLRSKGYDYWALGHVHDFAILSENPHIVFPGNLQGRNIRETGAKGAAIVQVRDRAVSDVTHVSFDVLRWARVSVDCGGLDDIGAVHAAARDRLSSAHFDDGDGRPSLCRIVLEGRTPLAGSLLNDQAQLRDELRAIAAAISPDLWLEKLSVRCEMPEQQQAPPAGAAEILSLVGGSNPDPAILEALNRELTPFLGAVQSPEDNSASELSAAVRQGDWQALLERASSALQARILQGGE